MYDIVTILVTLIFIIALFLALRMVVLWYWKVDVVVEALSAQTKQMEQINKNTTHQTALLSVIATSLVGEKQINIINKTTGDSFQTGLSGLSELNLSNYYIEII